MNGNVYLVATPIGNLDDISKRAVKTLASVDVIFAEDTRETLKLLGKLSIVKKIISFNDHNELSKINNIIERVENGQNIAIVSDRGTPLISDPGYKLVHELRKKDINVIPIPGPVAFVNALIASGLPTDQFLFFGFLKYKSKYLMPYAKLDTTLIFYESAKRIEKLAAYLLKELGNREVALAREITKQFETFYISDLENILNKQIEYKGEFVVVVGPPKKQEPNLIEINEKIQHLLKLDKKKLIESIVKEKYDMSKNQIYNFLHRKED